MNEGSSRSLGVQVNSSNVDAEEYYLDGMLRDFLDLLIDSTEIFGMYFQLSKCKTPFQDRISSNPDLHLAGEQLSELTRSSYYYLIRC